MKCDNFDECGEELSSWVTLDRARVKGWHVYDGTTIGGRDVIWTLGPKCVGQRKRLPPAPEFLSGQEELF